MANGKLKWDSIILTSIIALIMFGFILWGWNDLGRGLAGDSYLIISSLWIIFGLSKIKFYEEKEEYPYYY